MGRGSASSSSKKSSGPEVLERTRLKKLAFSNNLLSDTPAKIHSPLSLSKFVSKHHGKDILRKSQRRNRFLFSFPGLLAPVASGGKIGELKDLATKNPILYLHFPQGQMKLFGTIVYPKNRYLSLQFSKGGKNAVCEDYFDNIIVFSEAWWIGTKEENPEEARLNFPKELIEGQGQAVEYDFKGGAGATTVNKQDFARSGVEYVERESPETELENDISDDKNYHKDLKDTVQIRHSKRISGKTFKFADVSSGDDSVESVATDISKEGGEAKKVKSNTSTIVLGFENEDTVKGDHLPQQVEACCIADTKSRELLESAGLGIKSNADSLHNRASLVQSTISTLFSKVHEKEKVEEKNEPKSSRKSPSSKASGPKLQHHDLKRKIEQAGVPRKRGKVSEGSGIMEKKRVYEVEDDDIEEFSSSTQDIDGSDEDWTA